MKTISIESEEAAELEYFGIADYKTQREVLEQVDRLLEGHGLQVIMIEDGDLCFFQIEKK